MAQQFSETAISGEEGSGTFNFDRWLIKHELSDIKQVLVDHNMSTLASLKLTNANFADVILDHRVKAVTSAHLVSKIIAAIQSLESIRNSQNQNEKRKSKLVFVSTIENEILSQIKQYLVDIRNLTDELKAIESQYHNKKQQNIKIIRHNEQQQHNKINKTNDDITNVFDGLRVILDKKEKELKNKMMVNLGNDINELDGFLQNTQVMVTRVEKYLQEKMDSCKEVYNNYNDEFDFHTESDDRRNAIINIGNATKQYFDKRMQEINKNKRQIVKYIEADLMPMNNESISFPILNVNSAIYNDICEDINSFINVQTTQNTENKITSKSEQIEFLKAKLTSHQKKINTMNNKLDFEISRSNEYNKQLSRLSDENQKLNAMVKSLNYQISVKQQQIDSTNKLLEDANNQIVKLNKRVIVFEEKVQEMTKDCFDAYGHWLYDLGPKNLILQKKVASSGGMICLSNVIENGVYIWLFGLVNCSSYPITIGVWKTKHEFLSSENLRNDKVQGKSYGFVATYSDKKNRLTKGDSNQTRQYAKQCRARDVIQMTLDLNKMEISYKVNKIDYGVAFSNIEKTSYKAAVSICYEKETVQLLDSLHVRNS